MDSLIVGVSAVVLSVLGAALYFWALEMSGLFDGADVDQERDEHEEHLGVDR